MSRDQERIPNASQEEIIVLSDPPLVANDDDKFEKLATRKRVHQMVQDCFQKLAKKKIVHWMVQNCSQKLAMRKIFYWMVQYCFQKLTKRKRVH